VQAMDMTSLRLRSALLCVKCKSCGIALHRTPYQCMGASPVTAGPLAGPLGPLNTAVNVLETKIQVPVPQGHQRGGHRPDEVLTENHLAGLSVLQPVLAVSLGVHSACALGDSREHEFAQFGRGNPVALIIAVPLQAALLRVLREGAGSRKNTKLRETGARCGQLRLASVCNLLYSCTPIDAGTCIRMMVSICRNTMSLPQDTLCGQDKNPAACLLSIILS
jgi:hypothetical protein